MLESVGSRWACITATEVQKLLPGVRQAVNTIRFLNFRNRPHRSRMSDHRQSVQDYIRACEALLKLGELSDKEAEVVEEMYGQIADKFLDGEP